MLEPVQLKSGITEGAGPNAWDDAVVHNTAVIERLKELLLKRKNMHIPCAILATWRNPDGDWQVAISGHMSTAETVDTLRFSIQEVDRKMQT